MRTAEFEEHEYTASLFHQLAANDNRLWHPGQVFEEYIGIDGAMYVHSVVFWALFGEPAPLQGGCLPRYDWSYIWRKRKKSRPLPDFRLNCFIQGKRPETGTQPQKKYRAAGIKGRHWRFETMKHQQSALERVAMRLGSRAIVVYASPTFHRARDLFHHSEGGTLKEQSTFPRISSLSGHRHWVYDCPGAVGHAFSKHERVSDPGLEEQIDLVVKESSSDEKPSPLLAERNLILLANSVIDALGKEDKRNSRVRQFLAGRLRLFKAIGFTPESGTHPGAAFLTIRLFCEVMNLRWLVVG